MIYDRPLMLRRYWPHPNASHICVEDFLDHQGIMRGTRNFYWDDARLPFSVQALHIQNPDRPFTVTIPEPRR